MTAAIGEYPRCPVCGEELDYVYRQMDVDQFDVIGIEDCPQCREHEEWWQRITENIQEVVK